MLVLPLSFPIQNIITPFLFQCIPRRSHVPTAIEPIVIKASSELSLLFTSPTTNHTSCIS